MDTLVDRCSVCEALVDLEDLFCSNCGTEAPDHRQQVESHSLKLAARNFKCRGCGASMNYDAHAQALKCPFCGSIDLEAEQGQGILAPEFVIPFAIDRLAAEAHLRGWLGSSFWHPGDLRSGAELTGLQAVYLPFWVFATNVSTHWTADSDRVPWGANASWYPVSGHREGSYVDLWVPAGSGLAVTETEAIFPYEMAAATPPERVDLTDVTVEQFQVSRRYARPIAQERLAALEARAVAATMPGGSRHIHVNSLMEGATSRPGLIPVYILAYRYRDRLFRYVVNGQTGRATGTSPMSYGKLAALVGLIVLFVVIIGIVALLLRN